MNIRARLTKLEAALPVEGVLRNMSDEALMARIECLRAVEAGKAYSLELLHQIYAEASAGVYAN